MVLLALVLTALCDDDALAGAAYRDALEATRREKYEEAIVKLQEALRNQPKEAEKLFYRDRDGRHKEPYYPHYTWSQIRALQARGEAAPARQRELFRDAITHLELTSHPSAAATLETVRAELAAVEKVLSSRVTVDAAIPALRLRIEQLCDLEKFEEAGRLLTHEKNLLDRHPAERTRLQETLDLRRVAALARYEKALDLALERVAIAPPLEEPEAILALLRSALLPGSVAGASEGRFAWLRTFVELCETLLPAVHADANATVHARSFEDAAAQALQAGTFSGFRAARNIAHTIRLHQIEALDDGKNDAELGPLLDGARKSAARCGESLDGRKEFESYRTTVLAAFQIRLQKIADRLAERKRFGEDLSRWIAQADGVLARPAAMADPGALRTVAESFEPLEASPAWEPASGAARAKALWNRAVLELFALLLEGEAVAAAVDRVAPRLRAAAALDPDVLAAGEPRLSPKIRERVRLIRR